MDWLSGIGGILSAGGGILDGIMSLFGDSSGDKAIKEAMELQRAMIEAGLAPQRNARGDVTSYGGPTAGWSVDLSPMSQALLTSSDNELLRRLTHDAGVRREGIDANASRRRDEGQVADSYLRQLQEPSPYNEDAITGALIEQATRGVSRGYDDASNLILRQLQRSGTPADNAVSKIASRRGQDLGDAILSAQIAGPQMFEGLESARTNRLLNPYNTLASRASNIDDIAFQPASFDPGTDSGLASSAARAPYSGAAGASTFLNAAQGLSQPSGSFGQIGIGLNSALGALDYLFADSGPTSKPGNQTNKPTRNFLGYNV